MLTEACISMPHGVISHNQRIARAPPNDRTGLSRAVLSIRITQCKDKNIYIQFFVKKSAKINSNSTYRKNRKSNFRQ